MQDLLNNEFNLIQKGFTEEETVLERLKQKTDATDDDNPFQFLNLVSNM